LIEPGADLRDQVLGIAEETLRGNWLEGERDGVEYGYSRPSPRHYPWQWYWDSCFHAIVWRRFAPERAERELRSLLAGGSEDGFIGHTIFWHRHVDWQRRWAYNVTSRRARNTATIQPPLLAWAWRIAVGDPTAEPRIAAHHRWLEANRDLDGDGLLWIVQPDESGLDSSPKFDAIWGRRAHSHLLFPFLIAHNRRLDWDARRILDAGGPLVCEVVTNVLWCLARIAAGEPSITPMLIDRLWDERRGLFLDLVRGDAARPSELDAAGGDRRVRVSTWSALAALALPDLPEPAALLALVSADLSQRGGAFLRAEALARPADAPLLARADLDQCGLASLDRPGAPGPRAGGDRDGEGPLRSGRP
jgi:hypothetical protein